MRLSTLVELGGFGCGVAAAFMLGTIYGLLALFVALLIIGYAIEDDSAAITVARMIYPIRRHHAERRARRAAKKAG